MRYGCVSPTPEIGDMDHSDAESSDASFEIVSAEGIDDSLTIPPAFKPCIKFHDIFDVYPMDADVVARVSASGDFKISSDDKVVVVPLAWSSVDQAVCVSKLNGFYVRFDVNELPKSPADQFYQLCYCTADGSIVGVSTPFFFREVHEEDLMEFQKEQNKEFWTFRSRFAVLTDLYWNSVKNNGNTRPDEMTGSCGAKNDSETSKESSVESFSTIEDAVIVDKSSEKSDSPIQVSEPSEKSATENCGAIEAPELVDDSSITNCSANDASEEITKSLAEHCNVIEDSETAEKASVETKSEDPLQPQPACVNQEPTNHDQKIPKCSEIEQNNIAGQTESKPITRPMDDSALNSGAPRNFCGLTRKWKDDRGKRFMDIGPWKLLVNDTFYDSSRDRNQYSEQTQQNSHDLQSFNFRRFAEYKANKRSSIGDQMKKVELMRLADFKVLHESTVGKLILMAMLNMPVEQLERDPLLCEARRKIRYDTLRHFNCEISKTPATNPPKEANGPVFQTILSLTSRIENQAALMQNLKMQLANETKTIETLKTEYLTYKNDMETRLKHCAKIYAKMSLKLRQLSLENRK